MVDGQVGCLKGLGEGWALTGGCEVGGANGCGAGLYVGMQVGDGDGRVGWAVGRGDGIGDGNGVGGCTIG